MAVAAKPFQVVDAFFGHQRFLTDSKDLGKFDHDRARKRPSPGNDGFYREIIPIWPQFIQVSEIL